MGAAEKSSSSSSAKVAEAEALVGGGGRGWLIGKLDFCGEGAGAGGGRACGRGKADFRDTAGEFRRELLPVLPVLPLTEDRCILKGESHESDAASFVLPRGLLLLDESSSMTSNSKEYRASLFASRQVRVPRLPVKRSSSSSSKSIPADEDPVPPEAALRPGPHTTSSSAPHQGTQFSFLLLPPPRSHPRKIQISF